MKRLLFFCIWICAVCLRAAVPTFESLEPTQFVTNNFRVAYRDPHTNDAGIIYPAITNTLTLVTNENVYGTFSLPSKVQLLVLGTNYLDMSTNTTWLLNSPTNDAAQVIISLSAGAYQGQLALITSQNGDNAFTLPNQSEQWDVPGAVVWLSGSDWIGTTNRGILMQYTAPDWVAIERFDPSGGGGGTVLGGGTPTRLAYWANASTLGDSPLARVDAHTLVFGDPTLNVVEVKFTNILGNTLRLFLDTNNVAHLVSANVDVDSQAGSVRLISATKVYNFNSHVFTPGTSNTFLLGTELFPWKEVHVGTNSLYLGTNSYSDNGTVLLRNGIAVGGSGSALWASAGGVLYPSPGTNAILIYPTGGLSVGQYSDAKLGDLGYSFQSYKRPSQGEQDFNGLQVLTENASNTNQVNGIEIDTDSASIALNGYQGGVNTFYFRPSLTFGIAHLLDTFNSLTNGDRTLSIGNAGTEYAYFGPGGSPALSLTSLAADNATNVALVVDTAAPWTTDGASSLILRNAGVDNLILSAKGGIIEGANTVANIGTQAYTDNYASVRDPSLGDSKLFGLHAFVIDPGGNWDGWEAYGTTNLNAMYLYSGSTNGANCWWRLWNIADPDLAGDPVADENVSSALYWKNRLGTRPLFLRPDIGDFATSVAYTMGTTYPLSTAGSLIAAFHNGFTNKFTVDFKGTAGVIHLDGFGSAPTISTNSGSGLSGASATITGSDLSGEITINTGLTPAVNASIVTVNFNTTYGAAPYVVLWPSSATSSVVGFLPYVTSTINGFSVFNPVALGLAGSTTYKYNFLCAQ